MQVLLLANAAATWYLVGLIWLVQRVHYPLFARVGASGFSDYQRAHVRRITPLVLPPMVIELLTALALLRWPPAGVPPGWLWVGAALVGVVWASTFALQVPCHHRLLEGFDAAAHRRLVAGNWLRTWAWTLRGLLVLALLLTAPE